MERVKRNYVSLLFSMLKIGCIGFGGGTALIPIIQKEVENRLVTDEEYHQAVLIANITPGALPVEIVSFIGKRLCGYWGMITAAIAIAFPGTFFTVLVLAVLSGANEKLFGMLSGISVIVFVYIIFILLRYVKKTYQECSHLGMERQGMFLIIMAFLLTCGKEIYQLAGLQRIPIFDLSVVQLMGISLFVICFTQGCSDKNRLLTAVPIVVLYCLCEGKAHVINLKYVGEILNMLMVGLFVYGMHKEQIKCSSSGFQKLKKELICWGIFLFIMICPIIAVNREYLIFIIKGLCSSVISFGGGDAYLAVAEGMFVQDGMIGYDDFYSKVVVVANSLPGSFLCKVLSGIGYMLGYQKNGIAKEGVLAAVAGFGCSIAASGATFSIVNCIFEQFGELEVIGNMKKSVKPIVAGLLLSVCLSIIYQIRQLLYS